MTKKKNSTPPRLCWFRFDVDAFFDDPRMRKLTTKEKTYWLAMCAKSFRSGGYIQADPATVADNTGATNAEASRLIDKLMAGGLLRFDDIRQPDDCYSRRMTVEYAIAQESYAEFMRRGRLGGEAKARKDKLIEGSSTTPSG